MMLVWRKSFSPCHSFSVQMNSCLIVKARAYTDIVKMQSCKNKDPQHSLLDKNGISDSAHVYTIFFTHTDQRTGSTEGNYGQPSTICIVIHSRSAFTQAPNMFFFVNFVIILVFVQVFGSCLVSSNLYHRVVSTTADFSRRGYTFSFFLLVLLTVSYLISLQGLFYVLVGFAIKQALIILQYFINKLTLRSS